jgi:hypothetical protein
MGDVCQIAWVTPCCLNTVQRHSVLCFIIIVSQESFVDEALSEMEGSTVADMFDFLSKEIIRLQVL